jgi:spore maturation protein A
VLNVIWVGLIVCGVLVAALHGHVELVTKSAFDSAKLGVETIISLGGVLIFWLGIARVAEESGLMAGLARLLRPILRLIFPSIDKDGPAMQAIAMNVAANMLGLGQAAPPFGLKAMQALQEVNDAPEPHTASDSMITFLVLNTAGVTLIPATIIAYRAAMGSHNPTEIVGCTLGASFGSTVVALMLDAVIRRRAKRASARVRR